MSSSTIQLDLPLGAGTEAYLTYLQHKRGVNAVRTVNNVQTLQLEVTYDSDLIALGEFGRLATVYGVKLNDTYRFEVFPFQGLTSADGATAVEQELDGQIGVLDSVVNYAAGLIFIGYDSTFFSHADLVKVLARFNVTIIVQEPEPIHVHEEHAEVVHVHTDEHDHDHEHEHGEEVHEHDHEHEHGEEVHEHDHEVHTEDDHEHTAECDHDYDHAEHEGHAHEDHDHGHHDHSGHVHEDGEHVHHHSTPPAFLPQWAKNYWSWIQIGIAGLLLLVGLAVENLFYVPTFVSVLFYVGSYYFAGFEVAKHAIPAFLRFKFDTDVLMVLAAIGAAILGAWAEGAFLLFLFALGHAGEDLALDKARNAINELARLMPETANVKHGNHYHETPVAKVKIADVVLVKPGDRIPVDGVVLFGASTVDQSSITGESVPVDKNPGDQVFTGTVNHTDSMEITVTSVAGDSTLGRVVKLVAEAQSQKSPTQRWVAKFTARFVPTVLVLTVLVMVFPPLFGWLTWSAAFYKALIVLVAASPCALAIGTPAATLSAIAQAARKGVLIKGGVYLEDLGTLEAIAFDKTGTLTQGRHTVQNVEESAGVTEVELLQTAGAVESLSNHPLAKALVAYCGSKGITFPQATGMENIPGMGVRAWLGNEEVLIGSAKLFEHLGAFDSKEADAIAQQVFRLEGLGNTVMIVSRGGKTLGLIGLADAPREGVDMLVSVLYGMGLKHIIMLTGDNTRVAIQVAKHVGITEVFSDLLPEEKLTKIKELDDQYDDIAMVGDGVNDAPALAAPAIGISVADVGSGVALETADVVLLGKDLSKLPFAMGLARQSQRIVKQNLVIALGVIVLLIIATLFGSIPLGVAVFLHEGSTVLVALNALRLLAYELPGPEEMPGL